MPFIDVRAAGEIAPGQEELLKAKLGEAIGLIPGKSERSLMIQFTDHCRLWFGGKQGNFVFVNVMLYGAAEKRDYEKFQGAVIPVLEEVLGAEKVYLKFEEVPNWYWKL